MGLPLRWFIVWLVAAALFAGTSAARADTTQQSNVTPTADAAVRIGVHHGGVTVTGWNKKEVGVRSTSGDVAVSTSDDGSDVSVRAHHGGDGAIEVSVPVGASVSVDTVDGAVVVRGVSGRVRVESVQGDIDVSGATSDVEARNVSGHVHLVLTKADVRASSVDGNVDVRLPGGGTASLRNVSGTTHLEGAHLTRVEARSVAGNLELAVDLSGSGPFAARTHSGAIHVVLPKSSATTVDAHSSRGEVTGADAGAPPSADGGRSELSLYSFVGTIDVTRK
jgi:DUF4097 and DUF4098 domain-containing protein YvlB